MTRIEQIRRLIALVAKARARRQDTAKARVGVRKMVLTKWDGDPPAPGEFKMPAEIIVTGDDRPTERYRPLDTGMTEAEVRRIMDPEAD